jgi:phosphoribosylanthranilate isomerase
MTSDGGREPARLWIKICGLTSAAAVRAAVDAGADAIGFVFAVSKRQVTPAQAAELARGAPAHVQRVAVMLHPQQALVDEVCAVLHPDLMQSDAEDFASVRLPTNVQALPVLRSGSAATRAEVLADLVGAADAAKAPTRLLFEGPVSGVGAASDWTLAATLARTTRLVLAGGLTPANVQHAIAQVRPYGVDVSSGVESAPGVKDPERIHEFVRSARAGA